MRDGYPLEVAVGMEFYSTDFKGVGGKLKTRFEDFIVEEVTPERQVLTIQEWPTSHEELCVGGERDRYISFILQKMGLSTIDASRILASTLNIPVHLVTYAGLKDKRALTVQAMSVPSRTYELLQSLNLSNITLRNLEYTHHPIQIGDLWGNQFKILLRNIEIDCEKAVESILPLKNAVLLNYFGIQRFGVARPNTHLVGASLVKRNYEEAIRLIVATTSEYESDELTEARLSFAEHMTPTEKLMELFPRDLRYEKLVVKYLIKHEKDYKGAISKIPPQILTIFVHSYQSYIFNRLINLRIKNGMEIRYPEPGDFIVKLDETHSGRDTWLYTTEANLEQRIEQVNKGEYGLAAPVPGYATKTPQSKQTELLSKILKDEKLNLLDFKNTENRSLDSPGGLHLVSMILYKFESKCSPEGLQLCFRLRKGSYATVVLREVMKNHPINRV